MDRLHQKLPDKDKDNMKTARMAILDFARRFDPSWLMALLLVSVYALKQLDTTGIVSAPPVVTELLLVSAVFIAAFRPTPRITFIVSQPLTVFIAMAAWHGYVTGQLPLPVVGLMAFAYVAHFWIHVQASAILDALRHITELEARLEAESGGVNVPPQRRITIFLIWSVLSPRLLSRHWAFSLACLASARASARFYTSCSGCLADWLRTPTNAPTPCQPTATALPSKLPYSRLAKAASV